MDDWILGDWILGSRMIGSLDHWSWVLGRERAQSRKALSHSPRQLAGQLTTQLPPTTSWLNSWSKTTKLVAPVRTVRDVVAPHTLVNTTTTEPALEAGRSARTSLLVFTAGTVGSPVAGAHLGKAPALAAEELILRAEVGAGNLILSTTAVRKFICHNMIYNSYT